MQPFTPNPNLPNSGYTSAVTPSSIPNGQAAPAPHGNWLERLLPTAGGIIGGIGGGLLGSAVAPGVGTVAGGVGGAAAGDALGQKLENDLTGSTGSTAEAAVEGGAGQLLGDGVGAVAGKVLGGAGQLADNAATKLVQGQFKGMIDANTAKSLSNMGITDASQVSKIAPLVTQGEGALSTGVKAALGATDHGVDITGLDTVANNVLTEHGAQAPSVKAVSDNLTSAMKNMVKPEDTTSISVKGNPATTVYDPGAMQNALPEDVFKQSQKMSQLADQAYNKAYDKTGSITNVEEANKGATYNALAKELESRAFGTNSDQPLQLTDEAKSAIINKLAPVKDINPDVYTHYVNAVNNAQNVQELRPLQADMVQASKALQSAQRVTAKGGGMTGADIARGAVGLATSPLKAVAGLALNSPAADKVGANALTGLSKVAGKAAASKVIPLLTRAGGIAATNLPNDVGASAGASAIPAAAPSAITNAGGAMQPATQDPTQQYYQTLLSQLQAQPADAQTGSILSQLGSVVPQVQKQDLAAPAINNLEGAYQNAGGAQGTLGGLLSNATSLIPGSAANTFSRDQTSTADTLASLLGITPAAAMQLLPQLTQNQATSNVSQGNLQSIMGGIGASPSGGSVLNSLQLPALSAN